MDIDVLINSCARPDILETSIFTFMKHIKTEKHKFRYLILEDMVDNPQRGLLGRNWIIANRDRFDEIVFATRRLGVGFWWQETVRRCGTKYHFHLEDDNEFFVDIDIDPIIDLMELHGDIIEVILCRGIMPNMIKNRTKEINGVEVTELKTMSISTGLFNTQCVFQLLNHIGWENKVHEGKILYPASKALGFRRYVLGHGERHYNHLGPGKGYKKGSWKM